MCEAKHVSPYFVFMPMNGLQSSWFESLFSTLYPHLSQFEASKVKKHSCMIQSFLPEWVLCSRMANNKLIYSLDNRTQLTKNNVRLFNNFIITKSQNSVAIHGSHITLFKQQLWLYSVVLILYQPRGINSLFVMLNGGFMIDVKGPRTPVSQYTPDSEGFC